MEGKTETVLDPTYLRPGIVTRAAAIGLAAIGIGAGVLLACYGASFFFPNNSKRIDGLSAKIGELVQRRDRTDEVVAKLDDLRHEAGKIGDGITARLASLDGNIEEIKHRPILTDIPGHREKTINGNVITSEVTVFHVVRHDSGTIHTGWTYPDGASANQQPLKQFCYWNSEPLGGTTSRSWIILAENGVQMPNIGPGVPRLEDALRKCVWWNGSSK